MSKRLDLTGQQFGRWVALHYAGQSHWWCRCDRGTERALKVNTLKRGLSRSCGCLHREIVAAIRFIDLTGQRFGRLTILKRDGTTSPVKWRCRCDCGQEVSIAPSNMKSGGTQSCGCLHKERAGMAGRFTKKHGHYVGNKASPEYKSWCSMKSRCSNPKHTSWRYYGGRGITVCDRWRNSFTNFLADMGKRPAGYTLDRIDPDGNYEPGNCRWATSREQARNKQPLVAYIAE